MKGEEGEGEGEIIELPDELWEKIFEYCDGKKLRKLFTVNKHFYNILSINETFWKKKCVKDFGFYRSSYWYSTNNSQEKNNLAIPVIYVSPTTYTFKEIILENYFQVYQWYYSQSNFQPVDLSFNSSFILNHYNNAHIYYESSEEDPIETFIQNKFYNYKVKEMRPKNLRNTKFLKNWPNDFIEVIKREEGLENGIINYFCFPNYNNKEYYERTQKNMNYAHTLPIVPGLPRLLAFTCHPNFLEIFNSAVYVLYYS